MDVFELDLSQDATRASLVKQLRDALGSDAWEHIEMQASRAGIEQGHHYHSAADVFDLIDSLRVEDAVKDHMRAVYSILANAEACVHETSVETVHFHEVGNASGLLNALIICLAFESLQAQVVRATSVQTGEGTIECAHGLMSIPAPATRAILMTGIPVCSQCYPGELCTPTSAALIKHFVTEFSG